MAQAEANVTCCDGKSRLFVAHDITDCLCFRGSKYTYVLFGEPEGRGFITMQNVDGVLILAPKRLQPAQIEQQADTIEHLRTEQARLLGLIRQVIAGNWSVTELQEAIGDV